MNNNNSSKISRMYDKNKTTNSSNTNINNNPGNNHSKSHKISYQKLSLSKSAKISNNKKDDKIFGNSRNTNKEKSLPPIYEVGDNDDNSTNNKRKSENNIINNSIDSNVDSYNKRIAYSNQVKNISNPSRHTISNFNSNTHKNNEINNDNNNTNNISNATNIANNASNTDNKIDDVNDSNANPLVYTSPVKYSNEQFYSNSERKATNLDSFSKLNNNSKRSNLLLSNHSKRSNKDPLLTKPKSKKSYSEMKANIYASYTANLDDIFALYKANKREWLLEFEEKILDIQRSNADTSIINKNNSVITSDLFNFDPYSFNITPIADISKHLIRLYKFWILLFAYRLNFFIIPITLFLREIRQARIQIIDLEFFFNEEVASLLKIHYTNEEIKSEFERLKKNYCNERIREIDYSENDHDGFVNFEVISVLLEHEIYDASSTESEYIKEEIRAREHSNTNSSNSNGLTDENDNIYNNNSLSSNYLLNKQELFEETINEFYSEYLLGNIEWQDQFSLTVFDDSILQYDNTIYKIIPKNQLGEFIVKNYKAWILIHFITLNKFKTSNDSKENKEIDSYNLSGFLRNVSNSLRQINPNDEMLYLIELIKITKHFFSKEEITTELKNLNKKYGNLFPENYDNLSNDNYIELFKHFEFKIESPASKEIILQKRSSSKNKNNFDNETKMIIKEEMFSETKQDNNSHKSKSLRLSNQSIQSHQYDDITTTQNSNNLKLEQLIEKEFQYFTETRQTNIEVMKSLINDNFSINKNTLKLISPISELSYFLIQKQKFMTLVNIYFQNQYQYPLKVFLRLLYYNKNLSKKISNNHLDSEFLYNRNNQQLINFFFPKIEIIKELFYLKSEYSYENIDLSSIMKLFNEDSLKKLNEHDQNSHFLTNYSTNCVNGNDNHPAYYLNNLDKNDFIHIDIEIILFEFLLNHCEYDLSSGNSIKLLKDYECFITSRNCKINKGFKDKNISEMMSKNSNFGSNISNNAYSNTNSSARNVNNEGNDIKEFTFREDTQKKDGNINNNNISKSHNNSNSNAIKNNDESDENYSTILNRESQITQYSKINDTSLLILNTQNKNYTNTSNHNHNINEIEEDKYSKNFPFSETKSNYKSNNYSSNLKINNNNSNLNNALFNTELSIIKNENTINNINSIEENNLYDGKVTPKLTSSTTNSKQLEKKQDRDPYSKFKKMFAPKNYDCFIPILEENNSINNSFADSNNTNLITSNIDNNSKTNLRNLNIKKIFSLNNNIKHIPQAFTFYLSSIPFKVVSHLDNMIGELKEKANMNNENNSKELFDNVKAFKHHDLIVSQIEFDIISKRFNDVSEEISKDNEEDKANNNEVNKIMDKKKTKNYKKKINKGKDNSKDLKNNKTKNKNKNKDYHGDSDSDITKEYINTISKKYRINNEEINEIKERKSIKYREFLYDEENNDNESDSENKYTSNKDSEDVKYNNDKSKHSNKMIKEDDSDDDIKEEVKEKSRKKKTKKKKKTKESIETKTNIEENEIEEEKNSENNDKDASNKRRSKSEIKHTKNTKNKIIKKDNILNKVNNTDDSDKEEKNNDTNMNDTDSEENERTSRAKSIKDNDANTKMKTKGKSKSTNKRKKK